MRIQLLSDLHLESEDHQPQPAAGADLLVLAGDIDSSWAALARFRDWPQPVVMVAGNHEFDGRELSTAWPGLRARCRSAGITLLEREATVYSDRAGRRVRVLGTIRWSDFDLGGPAQRARAMRSAGFYLRLMQATRGGAPFDAVAVREEALACRHWLAETLAATVDGCDATVVVTHYAPSLRSADPRYGSQPSTASFCNADDDLLPLADLWLHGHLHCRHDYRVAHAGGATRVVGNPRGHFDKGEPQSYDGQLTIEV